MVTYKIKKNNKNKEEIIIEKSGLTAEFTFSELAIKIREWAKQLKEFKDNKAISTAMVMNIEKNYPKIASMKSEELKAATILAERRKFIVDVSEDIKVVQANLKNYEVEVRRMKEEFDIDDELEVDKAFDEFHNMKSEAEEILKSKKK